MYSAYYNIKQFFTKVILQTSHEQLVILLTKIQSFFTYVMILVMFYRTGLQDSGVISLILSSLRRFSSVCLCCVLSMIVSELLSLSFSSEKYNDLDTDFETDIDLDKDLKKRCSVLVCC